MVTDPISDMLIRIKNAGSAGQKDTLVPYSKFKFSVATMLSKIGFVSSVSTKKRGAKKFLDISIAYSNKKPKISGIKRMSKPSRRVYYGVSGIKNVKNGYGFVVLSTPKGILTGNDAKKQHVGGEALFEIW